MSDYTYYSAAETAKLIRAQLKIKFPGTKFWVRSKTYSGGASIDIDWIDGPAAESVQKITHPFSGAGFDGMNDYKTSNMSYLLPDGSATFARLERYNDNDVTFAAPEGGKLVHFGADYIFENHHYSPEYAKPIIEQVCKSFGVDLPKYYESHPFFGPKENTNVTVLSWDFRGVETRGLEYHINRDIHTALAAGKFEEPEPINVTAQPEPVETVQVGTLDENWEPVYVTVEKFKMTSSAPYGMKF